MNDAFVSGNEASQQPGPCGRLADDHFAFFLLRVLNVVGIKRMPVPENGHGFVKCDSVFGVILFRFGGIPLVFHCFWFCHARSIAYVNRKPDKLCRFESDVFSMQIILIPQHFFGLLYTKFILIFMFSNNSFGITFILIC